MADEQNKQINGWEAAQAANEQSDKAGDRATEKGSVLRKVLKALGVGCLVLVVLILMTRKYFVNSRIYDVDMIEYSNVTVSDRSFSFKGELKDRSRGVADIRYQEKDGVLKITMEDTAKSWFKKNSFGADYEAEQDFYQVQLNETVIWDRGNEIPYDVARVYETAHLYVGDMSANNKTAGALGIGEILGGYANELQTTKEPYGWKFFLKSEFAGEKQEKVRQKMGDFACVLIGCIGNLDEVSFEYEVDGEKCFLTVTEADADKIVGESVKGLAGTPSGLQKLMQSVNLTKEILYVK